MSLHDIVGSTKETESNLQDLMRNYQYLLRDSTAQLESSSEDVLTKEQLVQELNNQVFKLSDFIDK